MKSDVIPVLTQFLDIYAEKIEKSANKKMYIWGTGSGGKLLAEAMDLRQIEYDGFIDGDRNKSGILFLGRPIVNPDSLNYEKENFLVFIGSDSFEEEIKQQLIDMGVEKSDIFSPYKWELSRFALIITNRCNLSCKWCAYSENYGKLSRIQHKGRDEISIFDAKQIMDIMVGNGFSQFLEISGGEPLLHSNFLDIFNYATDLFEETVIQTSGTLLNDALISAIIDKAEHLKDTTRKITVYVSLTGYTEDVYRMNQGSGRKDCGSLLEWLKKNIQSLLSVRNDKNLRDKIRVKLRYLINDEVLDFDDVRSYLDFWGDKVDVIELNKKFDKNMSRGKTSKAISKCTFLGGHAVYPNGDVLMCCNQNEALEYKLGNIINFEQFKNNYLHYMEQMMNLNLKSMPELCRTCAAIYCDYADRPFTYADDMVTILCHEYYVREKILESGKICIFGITPRATAFYFILRMWELEDRLQIAVVDFSKEGSFASYEIKHCDSFDYEDYLICSFDSYHLSEVMNSRKLTNQVIELSPEK